MTDGWAPRGDEALGDGEVALDRGELEGLVAIANHHQLGGALELEVEPPGMEMRCLEDRRRIDVAEDLPEARERLGGQGLQRDLHDLGHVAGLHGKRSARAFPTQEMLTS